MEFLDRHEEKRKILRIKNSGAAELIVVYGRRRCGKSTLLKQVLNKGDIYHQADLSDRRLQMKALATEVGHFHPGIETPDYPDWESLLTMVSRVLSLTNTLVIDEFPYLVKNSPELPSVLQKMLDNQRISFTLVLCGSSQQMMHDLLLKKSEPLYGRASLVLKLEPLTPGYISSALNVSSLEGVEEYAHIGGVPRYWEIRSKYLDRGLFLKEELFDKDSLFFEEPIRLLTDDMRSSVQAYSILSLIGQGCHRLSEIAGRLGRPSTDLSRPIANLLDLGYIRKEIPWGENPKNSKKSLYKIDDCLFHFFFRFMLPNKSAIELGLKQKAIRDYEEKYPIYRGEIWEDLCRKAVPYLSLGYKQWEMAGRWWGTGTDRKEMEIDILALSVEKDALLIGECKWKTSDNFDGLKKQLIKKAKLLPFKIPSTIIPALFIANPEHSTDEVISADEIMKMANN